MIDLSKRVAEGIDRFTGRAWLLPKLLEWWEDGTDRVFLLTGGPGTGKSMIVAWLGGYGPSPEDPTAREQLARVRTLVKAAHFCQAASRNVTPQAFAESVANQLTGTVPRFGDALAATLADRVSIVGTAQAGTAASGSSLTGVAISRIELGALGDELSFDRAFTQPLKKLYASGYSQPMFLLVDALDEAQIYTGVTIPNLLSRLTDLPAPVRFLVTTRDEPRILKMFRGVQPFDLIRDAPADIDDVGIYAAQRLKKLGHISDAKRRAFAERLSKQAGGVFLYAAMVLDELLQTSTAGFPDLATYPLPKGLSGLYQDFLNRELGKDEQLWSDRYRPLLGLIAVAQGEGLTAAHLTSIVKRDQDEIGDTLRRCKQYLSGELPKGPFRAFHKSFSDFLLEDKQNVDYHIEPASMHKRIAEHYWSKYSDDWAKCDHYGLRHLSDHLYALHDDPDFGKQIHRLINRRFLETKHTRFGSDEPFARDVRLSVAAASKCEPSNLTEEIRGSAVLATLNSQAANVPDQTIAALVWLDDMDRVQGLTALRQKPADYVMIANVDSQAGRAEEARQTLKNAFELAADAPTFCAIAAGYADIGLRGDAEKALARGVALLPIPRMPQTTESSPFRTAVKVSAELGEIATMLQFIERSPWPSAAARARAELADALVSVGQKRQAREILRVAIDLAGQHGSLNALARCAVVLMRLDDRAQGLKMANRISSELKRPKHNIRRDAVNDLLAQAFAYIGDFDRAEELVTSIAQARHRDRALSIIAACYARQRKFDPAVVAARKTQERIQGTTLANIVRVLAENGDYSQAIALAQEIEGSVGRIEAWAALGDVLSREPDRQKGRASVDQILCYGRSIKNREERPQLLSSMALVCARFGDSDRAAKLAQKSIDASRGPVDREGLVRALCQFSNLLLEFDPEYARTIAGQAYNYARNIYVEGSADRALSEAAKALIRLGQVEKATEARDRIADESLREELSQILTSRSEGSIEFEKATDALGEVGDDTVDVNDLVESAGVVDDDADACVQLMEAVRLAVQLGDQPKAEDLAREVYSKLDKLKDEQSKIKILVDLIDVYRDAAPNDLAKKALKLTLSISEKDKKLELLLSIAPKVLEHLGLQTFLDAAATIHDDGKLELLKSIALKVVGEFGSDAFLDAVGTIHDPTVRATALEDATNELVSSKMYTEALPLWRRSLLADRNLNRPRMNWMLECGAPIVFSVDRGKTLRKACSDILEVENWWEEESEPPPVAN
jgi:tetratricopeptide (TPR) repeat protein